LIDVGTGAGFGSKKILSGMHLTSLTGETAASMIDLSNLGHQRRNARAEDIDNASSS
jgi:hypothetical protein